jgi:hypothetical protein
MNSNQLPTGVATMNEDTWTIDVTLPPVDLDEVAELIHAWDEDKEAKIQAILDRR